MIKNHNLQAVSLKSTFSYYWACLRDRTPKSETGLTRERFFFRNWRFPNPFISFHKWCICKQSESSARLPDFWLQIFSSDSNTVVLRHNREAVLILRCCRYLQVVKRLFNQRIKVKIGRKEKIAILFLNILGSDKFLIYTIQRQISQAILLVTAHFIRQKQRAITDLSKSQILFKFGSTMAY